MAKEEKVTTKAEVGEVLDTAAKAFNEPYGNEAAIPNGMAAPNAVIMQSVPVTGEPTPSQNYPDFSTMDSNKVRSWLIMNPYADETLDINGFTVAQWRRADHFNLTPAEYLRMTGSI